MRPLISIILVTYNRCEVLKLAIQSVLGQTFRDWELWVMGEACTDDTEKGVAAFKDPRIHFVNLENQGEEPLRPNNEGFRLSRGAYIAYLHHDDLWLSDHLETVLSGIQRTRADLVFTLTDRIMKNGIHYLTGAKPAGQPRAYNFIPASSWFLRRELLEEITPLRFYKECHAAPSQEWLFRAHRAKKDIRLIRKMTVISVQSGY